MKKTWTVYYQLPEKSYTQSFDSFEEAKLFARQIISQYSSVPKYLDDIRCGRRKKYRAAIADFFEKYFKDPRFPYSDDDIPSYDADDYDEQAPDGMIFGDDLDDDDYETDCEYENPEDYFDEDDIDFYASSDSLWIDDIDEINFQHVSSNLVLGNDTDEEYEYDESGIYVRISQTVRTGGRSNPVIILRHLQSGRRLRLSGYDDTSYGIGGEQISTRTVYRHIKLLSDLGYVIEKSEDGFILTDKTVPKNIKFGKSAYPIMVLEVLSDAEAPLLQSDIIEKIQLRYYGTTVHRKAIGNIIKELTELGYHIEHTKRGYVLIKA